MKSNRSYPSGAPSEPIALDLWLARLAAWVMLVAGDVASALPASRRRRAMHHVAPPTRPTSAGRSARHQSWVSIIDRSGSAHHCSCTRVPCMCGSRLASSWLDALPTHQKLWRDWALTGQTRCARSGYRRAGVGLGYRTRGDIGSHMVTGHLEVVAKLALGRGHASRGTIFFGRWHLAGLVFTERTGLAESRAPESPEPEERAGAPP